MDWSWINSNWIGMEYENDAEYFLLFVQRNVLNIHGDIVVHVHVLNVWMKDDYKLTWNKNIFSLIFS